MNNETILRVQQNDPELTTWHLDANNIANDIDLSASCLNFSENTHLRKLRVSFFEGTRIEQFACLFHEISRIQSLKEISVYNCVLDGAILQLFRIRGLISLSIVVCTITNDAIVALKQTKIEHLRIRRCSLLTKELEIIRSINQMHRLQTIDLETTSIDEKGFREIEQVLVDPLSSLEHLSLDDCCTDDGLSWLSNGLVTCKTLKRLRLRSKSMTERGWKILASVLAESAESGVRELDLRYSHINEDGALELAGGIARSKSLEKLELQLLESVSGNAMKGICASLGSNSSLKSLNLAYNDAVTDDVVSSLALALLTNSSVEELCLLACRSVNASGWMVLSNVFSSSTRTVLKKLDISGNAINDEVICSFADGLKGTSSLKYLGISRSSLTITAIGWAELSALLSDPDIGLETICICSNNVGDEALSILANGLTFNNKKLQKLDICGNSITSKGWEPLVHILCNVTTIDATMYSNHTLSDIGEVTGIPPTLKTLLEMNAHKNKSKVARYKVMENHFSDTIHVHALAGGKQKVMPRVISWFGRDALGFRAIYEIIRGMPELVERKGASCR